jgi:outer membrane biosynthesis protein TonB
MSEDPDPRRSAFAKVSVRPPQTPEPNEEAQPEEEALRGLGAPPPPKPPTVTVTEEPTGSPPAIIATPIPDPPPPPQQRSEAKTRQKSTTRPRSRKEPDDAAESFGTQRGNLRYVQTSLSAGLAEQLDITARDRRMVVGDVVMEAVQAFAREAKGSGRPVRRPKGGNPVRKDIGLFPDEAAEDGKAVPDDGRTDLQEQFDIGVGG